MTLLEHTARSLPAVPRRFIVAPPRSGYALGGWTLHAERWLGAGPLAALETALALARQQAGEGWVAVTAVDHPLLTPAVWAALTARLAQAPAGPEQVGQEQPGPAPAPAPAQAVAVRHAGQLQPLPALYHTSLHPALAAALHAGERRLRLALTLGPVLAADLPPGLATQAVSDADTPEALRRLTADRDPGTSLEPLGT